MITEGIWKAAEKGTMVEGIYSHRVFSISDTVIVPANGYATTAQEAKDNAHLIAASKELLAACKAIVNARDRAEPYGGMMFQQALDNVENAYAKATNSQ